MINWSNIIPSGQAQDFTPYAQELWLLYYAFKRHCVCPWWRAWRTQQEETKDKEECQRRFFDHRGEHKELWSAPLHWQVQTKQFAQDCMEMPDWQPAGWIKTCDASTTRRCLGRDAGNRVAEHQSDVRSWVRTCRRALLPIWQKSLDWCPLEMMVRLPSKSWIIQYPVWQSWVALILNVVGSICQHPQLKKSRESLWTLAIHDFTSGVLGLRPIKLHVV